MTLTLNTLFYSNNPVSWVEAIMALLGRMGGKKLAQVSGRQAAPKPYCLAPCPLLFDYNNTALN